jgi:hypothetical protein
VRANDGQAGREQRQGANSGCEVGERLAVVVLFVLRSSMRPDITGKDALLT